MAFLGSGIIRRRRRPTEVPATPEYNGKIAVLWVVNGHGQHLVAEHANGKFGPLACVRAREGENPYGLAMRAAKTALALTDYDTLGVEVGPGLGITLYRRRYEVQVYVLRVSDHERVTSLDTTVAATRLGHVKAWWSDEACLIADLSLNAGRYLIGARQCLMELAARQTAWASGGRYSTLRRSA